MIEPNGPSRNPDVSRLLERQKLDAPDFTADILGRVDRARPFVDAPARRSIRFRRVGILALSCVALVAVALVQRIAPRLTDPSPATLTSAVQDAAETGADATARVRDGFRQLRVELAAPFAVAAVQDSVSEEIQTLFVIHDDEGTRALWTTAAPSPARAPSAQPAPEVTLVPVKRHNAAPHDSWMLSLQESPCEPSQVKCVVFADGLAIPVARTLRTQGGPYIIHWPEPEQITPQRILPASLAPRETAPAVRHYNTAGRADAD